MHWKEMLTEDNEKSINTPPNKEKRKHRFRMTPTRRE
jgi:hypothetical protein